MRGIRLIAIGLVLAAAVQAGRQAVAENPPVNSEHVAQTPLVAELQRCKALGGDAQKDEKCTAAYAENRQRFFRRGSAYEPSKNIDLYPATPDPKPVPKQDTGR